MPVRNIDLIFNAHNEEDYTNAVCVRTTRGKHVVIDVDDFEFVSSRTWRIHLGWNNTPYATTSVEIGERLRSRSIHRLLMNPPSGMVVDHRNRNTLDNRRQNLRICTRTENTRNRVSRTGTSIYKGVFWVAVRSRWVAKLLHDKKQVWLGAYQTEEEAAEAYNRAAVHYFGEFACLNCIQPRLPTPTDGIVISQD